VPQGELEHSVAVAVEAALEPYRPELRELVRRAVDVTLVRVLSELVAAELELRRNGRARPRPDGRGLLGRDRLGSIQSESAM
jgi:hypothetical protein